MVLGLVCLCSSSRCPASSARAEAVASRTGKHALAGTMRCHSVRGEQHFLAAAPCFPAHMFACLQALQAIGCCDQAAYDLLYTTQLLLRATSQPERTAAILGMSIPQRLAYVTKCVERFSLLLPKYDRTGASTRLGPASEQTDRCAVWNSRACAVLEGMMWLHCCFDIRLGLHRIGW
jgi:hypothetical protein